MNRQLTGVLADLHFAPTDKSAANLQVENKRRANLCDWKYSYRCVKTTVKETYEHEVLTKLGDDRLILLTAHRRENLGEPMKICSVLLSVL